MRFLIISTIGLLGCLSEQGVILDADANSETSTPDGTVPDGTQPDGTIPDGTVPDGTIPDIGPDGSNPCDNVVCDDNDDCTFDQCNPETGLCEYFGVPGAAAPAQCISDADCEDGDPCTANSCIFQGCGAGSYCTAEQVPGCGTSCATGCVDDDPCTRDLCRADICYHLAELGCDAECVSGPLYGVQDVIMGANANQPSVKATGLLTFDPRMQSCDDGPDCGCQGYAQLSEGNFGLYLRDQQLGVDLDAWACKSSGCGEPQVTCNPAHADVRYRVWGRGLYEWDLPNADVIASYSGVAVQGFCLETQGVALVGNYKGQIVFANYQVDFDASIRLASNGQDLRLAYGNAFCVGCGPGVTLPDGEVPLTPGSGFADIEGAFPSTIGTTEQRVRLFSNRNALIGEYGGVSGINFIAPPPGGTITLTRLAP